jgi:RecA-family ATPase
VTLGSLPCAQGDVLYAALEDNQRRLQRRMAKLSPGAAPTNLTFTCDMPKLADGGLQYIKDWVKNAQNPKLVIVDTLAMVRSPKRKDQTAYEADYESVRELRDLATAHNLAIIIVHHLRKAEADDSFDTISGTLGLTGCPDTIMIIRREGSGVILEAKGRDIEEIKKAVEFDAATAAWTITGDADTVRQSAERNAVLKAFREANGEALGPQQIAATTGMKAGNVRKLIHGMKAAELVRMVKYGKYALTGETIPKAVRQETEALQAKLKEKTKEKSKEKPERNRKARKANGSEAPNGA